MYKRILALCLVLVFSLSLTAGASKTLTAVNDRFLTYSSSSAPVYKNGEYYVPYSVFSNFGITGTYYADTNMLTLSSGGTTLTFGVSQGTAYDQNGNSYPYPPYAINGTVYVPVRLVCGRFGLMFSVINADTTVLRIYNSSAVYDDSAFLTAHSDHIAGVVGTDKPATSNPTGTVPVTPVTYAPEALALTYLVPADGANLPALLDQLEAAHRTATFLLPTDLSAMPGACLRQLVGSGYPVGFAVGAGDTPAQTQLQGANAQLWAQTGTQTRLYYTPTALDEEQALTDAGYIAYQPTHRTTDKTAYQEMDTLREAFIKSKDPVAVLVEMTSQTAELTTLLLQYARTEGCDAQQISVFAGAFLE